MKPEDKISPYPPQEERLNIITHGIGFVLSIFGLIFLIYKAIEWGQLIHQISAAIFGISMILLYAASTLYHSAKTKTLRYKLNILDHSSIYVLIAGTYTPIALITLNGIVGWSIFIIIWLMAVVGVILKFYFIGRFEKLSTSMYVLMGWIIVFAVKPLIENFSTPGLWLLFAGGISYTIGAIFFSLHQIKYNHAIFHLFVLGGTACHFFAIYEYVLPSK